MAKGDKQEGASTGKTTTAIQLPSERMIKRLLKSGEEMKEAVDGLVGSHREEIKNAVDKSHLNKTAFAMVKKLYGIKSNETLAMIYDHFIEYLAMSGVLARIESVQNLPFGDEKETEDQETEQESGKDAGNVRQFGGSRRRSQAAAEAAE